MGDRATVNFDYGTEGIIQLSTHWGGHRLPADLQAALASDPARRRYGDDSYLGRILVSQLIGEDWAGELNYGLAPGDTLETEYVPLTVNLPARTVTIGTATFGYAEYIALDARRLAALWGGYDDAALDAIIATVDA